MQTSKMFNVLDKLKDIKIFEKFFSENTTNHFHGPVYLVQGTKDPISSPDKNRIIIDIGQLKESKKEVIKLIEEFTHQKGNKLFEKNSDEILEKLEKYNPKQNNGIVEFFKNIIPEDDHNILISAQFIVQQSSSEISYLKRGLGRRYGTKGPRIVNLLSAGYFEFLKELFNSDENLFKETYKQLVIEDALTIFVHNDTNLISELYSKINKFHTYKLTLRFIHIHGIGLNNTEKIRKFVKEYSDDAKFIIKSIKNEDRVMIVEIYPN